MSSSVALPILLPTANTVRFLIWGEHSDPALSTSLTSPCARSSSTSLLSAGRTWGAPYSPYQRRPASSMMLFVMSSSSHRPPQWYAQTSLVYPLLATKLPTLTTASSSPRFSHCFNPDNAILTLFITSLPFSNSQILYWKMTYDHIEGRHIECNPVFTVETQPAQPSSTTARRKSGSSPDRSTKACRSKSCLVTLRDWYYRFEV